MDLSANRFVVLCEVQIIIILYTTKAIGSDEATSKPQSGAMPAFLAVAPTRGSRRISHHHPVATNVFTPRGQRRPRVHQTLRALCTTKPTTAANTPSPHTPVPLRNALGSPMPARGKRAPRHRPRRACQGRACTPRRTCERPKRSINKGNIWSFSPRSPSIQGDKRCL